LLSAGTAAKVRVIIQSQDEKDIWSTIGVSENIIEAIAPMNLREKLGLKDGDTVQLKIML
jgi:CTP-dependent riboflavin kinase